MCGGSIAGGGVPRPNRPRPPTNHHLLTAVCHMPLNHGRGEENLVRWYYDARLHQCAQFIYSGQLGNQNNFPTRQMCADRCESKSLSTL